MARNRVYLQPYDPPERVIDGLADVGVSYRFSTVLPTPGWGRLIVETQTAQLKHYVNEQMLRRLIKYLAMCLTDLENENRDVLRKEAQNQ